MKIRLRKTTEADLDFVVVAEQAAENRPFVTAWMHEQHKSALESEDTAHLVIENVDGKRVGYVILAGLKDENRSIEFRRIVVTEKNCGYGTQALREIKRLAFDEIRAHRLWLDVKETNSRARHIYQTEGFVAEGVLRECLKTEAGYDSLVVMSMLGNEYEFQREQAILGTVVREDSDLKAAAEK